MVSKPTKNWFHPRYKRVVHFVGRNIQVIFRGAEGRWVFQYGKLITLIVRHKYQPPDDFVARVMHDRPELVAFNDGDLGQRFILVGCDTENLPIGDVPPGFLDKLRELQDRAVRTELSLFRELRYKMADKEERYEVPCL